MIKYKNELKIQKEEPDTLVLDLTICQLFIIIFVVGFLYLKTDYKLYVQQSKAHTAMTLALDINNEKSKLEEKNNELIKIIHFQKKLYESELKKRDKYENIIKDIDRTWNEPK